MYGGQSTYIPLKVNQAGVVPIIFASSILLLPVLFSNMLGSAEGWRGSIAKFVNDYLVNSQNMLYITVFFGFIVAFAYFYNSIGTKVTIVEFMDRIVPVEDEEVSKALEKIYKKSGITIMTSSEVTKVDTKGAGCKVTVKTAKGEEVLDCEVVLSAAGVVSNLENIGLEEVGILVDKGKIQVNDYYQTNMPGYYAIGDVVPGPALAHVASAEGIICVEKIAGHHPEALDYANIPGCTYCSPEIASVGMTEAKAKAAGHDVRIGKFPFSASVKASAAGAKDGFVKLVFDKKYGEILGAHMIGANVTEMIAEIVAIRKLETTGQELIKTVHPHPTMSEAIMEAAAAAYDEVIHL
jgi:dihydrolipoamide dehydrogenase